MKKLLIVLFCVNLVCSESNWIIVGAGPAGIITAALLLDIGTPAKNICMVDPSFNIGDLSLYPNVPANTKNKLWVDFLSSFKILREFDHPSFHNIFNVYDPEKEYDLATIIEPLRVVSDYIKSKVAYIKDKVDNLYFHENNWRVGVSSGELVASHVVLATGSHPKKLDLNLSKDQREIALVDALDIGTLSSIVGPNDTVAVFGSAHSAILILKNLCSVGTKEIVNFYNKPLSYTQDMGTWYENISSGLKGATADWAKNVLEANPPANLRRVFYSENNVNLELPRCTKVIYAVGFEKNHVSIKDYDLSYNDTTGIIAPRLFGIGIAFPEKYIEPSGHIEHRVGINSFTEYALKVVPEWAKCKNNSEFVSKICMFNKLLSVEIL